MPAQRRSVIIDDAQCRGCGLCILACPAGCLEFADGINGLGYRSIRYSGEHCVGEGLCIAACPGDGVIVVLEEIPRRAAS